MREGKAEILVLSDREADADGLGGEAATRAAAAGRSAEMAFIPPMIAVGAVHHHLIQVGDIGEMQRRYRGDIERRAPPPPPGGAPHGHVDHRRDGAGALPCISLCLPVSPCICLYRSSPRRRRRARRPTRTLTLTLALALTRTRTLTLTLSRRGRRTT